MIPCRQIWYPFHIIRTGINLSCKKQIAFLIMYLNVGFHKTVVNFLNSFYHEFSINIQGCS